MAKLTVIIIALVINYMVLQAVGQMTCSTVGTKGLAGCECNFLGACDIYEKQRVGLSIMKHLPKGLELYGHRRSVLSKRNLAYLCEGNTVAILYDCSSRIPLYAATVIKGGQLNGADGGRPTNDNFRLSRRGLPRTFQQSNGDYSQAVDREICYKRRGRPEIIDALWYRAKHSTKRPLSNSACAIGNEKLKVMVHRGHLIASQYGIGKQRRKEATFVYTNAVPQFGDFNSAPWRICEGRLILWGKNNCAMDGKARNVQMFILAGAIPSTLSGSPQTRYFGRGGFSNYQDIDFRVNVPKVLWTAACCTFEHKVPGNTWQAAAKSTAFWRENVPGSFPCIESSVGLLEQRLKEWAVKFNLKTPKNLFPYSSKCKNLNNHVRL